MTSNINPNDINGSYPVAGQDNNSQGFRDNFTNTATNFQYAADEITDLQNKAVLKAALVGTTLNNNMNGVVLSNAQLQQMTETVVPLGTLTGSVTLNFALASYQKAADLIPDDVDLCFMLGKIYRDLEKKDEEAKCYDKLILNINNIQALQKTNMNLKNLFKKADCCYSSERKWRGKRSSFPYTFQIVQLLEGT